MQRTARGWLARRRHARAKMEVAALKIQGLESVVEEPEQIMWIDAQVIRMQRVAGSLVGSAIENFERVSETALMIQACMIMIGRRIRGALLFRETEQRKRIIELCRTEDVYWSAQAAKARQTYAEKDFPTAHRKLQALDKARDEVYGSSSTTLTS